MTIRIEYDILISEIKTKIEFKKEIINMMNEYEKQAVDFCNKWEIEIKWMFVGVGVNSEWGNNEKRNHWHWIFPELASLPKGNFGIVLQTHRKHIKT